MAWGSVFLRSWLPGSLYPEAGEALVVWVLTEANQPSIFPRLTYLLSLLPVYLLPVLCMSPWAVEGLAFLGKFLHFLPLSQGPASFSFCVWNRT